MSPRLLSYDEIKNIEYCAYKFLPYNGVENIGVIGNISKMYKLIFYGHKSRAFELFLALGSSKLVLPDWVFEYFGYGARVIKSKK